MVDDYGGAGFGFAVEQGPDGALVEQFQRDYGYAWSARVRDNTPWTRDMQKIVVALSVVGNSGPTRIGGAGEPRQPLAGSLK